MNKLYVLFNTATFDSENDEVPDDRQDDVVIEAAKEDVEEVIYLIKEDDPDYLRAVELTNELQKLMAGKSIG